jgi:hypothetical protein
MVMTRDHGPQPIRWVGSSSVIAMGKLAPVRIAKGALGNDLPQRDLFVSRQHRILLQSRIAQRMFGSFEILVPAIKLTQLPGIEAIPSPRSVRYFHLLLDRHEIIKAEGTQSETLLTGPEAKTAMGDLAVAELELLFPGLIEQYLSPARPICQNARLTAFFGRHLKNGKVLVH